MPVLKTRRRTFWVNMSLRVSCLHASVFRQVQCKSETHLRVSCLHASVFRQVQCSSETHLWVSCLHASVFRQVQCKSETHLRVSCLHTLDRSSAAQRHTFGSAVFMLQYSDRSSASQRHISGSAVFMLQTGPVQLRDTSLGQLSPFRQVQCKSETHLRVSCLHASDRSSAAQGHTFGSAVSIQTGPVQLRDTPLGQLSPCFRLIQCSSETHLWVSCLHSDRSSAAQRHTSGSAVSMLQTGPVQLRDTSLGQLSPCFRQIQCSSETHLRVSCLHASDRSSAAQRHISGSAVSMLQTDTVQLRDTSPGQLSPCCRHIQCSSETHLWVSCLHSDRYSAAQRHISGSAVSMLQTDTVQLRDTPLGQLSPFRQAQCSSETHLRVSCLHASDRYSAAQRHTSGSAVSMLQTDTVQLRDTSLGQLSPCCRQVQYSSETHLYSPLAAIAAPILDRSVFLVSE